MDIRLSMGYVYIYIYIYIYCCFRFMMESPLRFVGPLVQIQACRVEGLRCSSRFFDPTATSVKRGFSASFFAWRYDPTASLRVCVCLFLFLFEGSKFWRHCMARSRNWYRPLNQESKAMTFRWPKSSIDRDRPFGLNKTALFLMERHPSRCFLFFVFTCTLQKLER